MSKPPATKSINPLLIVAALTVVAAILRLYNITTNSLWLDEASTYYISLESFGSIWSQMVAGEFNPPLFYWIVHLMLNFGHTELMLRIIPALCGIALVPVMYYVGKELLNDTTGLIAAVLTTVNPVLIMYSQEARAYMPATLCVAISLVFYLRFINHEKNTDLVLFGVFSGCAFWFHFYAVLSFVALVGILFFTGRRLWDTPIATVSFVATTLPLIPVIGKLFFMRSSLGVTWGMKGWDLVSTALIQFLGMNLIVASFFVIFFIFGLYLLAHTNGDKAITMAFYIGVVILLSMVLSYRISMHYRYLLFVVPVLTMGIAAGFEKIKPLVGTNITLGVVLLMVLLQSPFTVGIYSYPREDWRSVAYDIAIPPSNVIVFAPGYIWQPFEFYAPYQHTIIRAYSVEDMVLATAQYQHGMVVVTPDITAISNGTAMIGWLQNNTRLVKEYNGITVVRW